MSENIKDLISQLKKRGLYNQYKRQSKYWEERFTLLENAQNNKCITYMSDVEQLYMKASNEVEKEVSKWYARYAKDNNISLSDAKKVLKANELKEFHMSVEEYIKKGESLDSKWVKELERASTKVHITRLEALQIQMRQQVEFLTGKKSKATDKLLKDIYEDVYYRTAFEVQKGFGVGFDIAKLDSDTIDKVLSKPWASDGVNFSNRVWGSHRMDLVDRLQNDLIMNIGGQVAIDKIIGKLAKDFEVSKGRAANLIYTEKAFFMSKAENDCYKNLGVEEYEICATLDNKTSDICRFMDGKVFAMGDYKIGATAPPFHNRCRTCTVPYFDDEFTTDEKRAVRDMEGNYYTVPADMKFEEWKTIFVEKIDSKKFDDEWLPFFNKKKITKVHNPNEVVERYMHIINVQSNDKEFINSIKNEFKSIPEEALKMLVDNKIKIVQSPTESSYEPLKKLINIKKETIKRGALPHEIGHVMVDINSLYERKDIKEIMQKIMDTRESVVSKYVNNDHYIYIKSGKFVRNYQGRTYITKNEYIANPDILDYRALEEYISVGFETFVKDPRLLYDKDRELYEIIINGGIYNEKD